MYVCSFETITQYILLPQSDGQLCLLKHVYITNEKVSESYVATLLHGTGREIAWGNGNKKSCQEGISMDAGAAWWHTISEIHSHT